MTPYKLPPLILENKYPHLFLYNLNKSAVKIFILLYLVTLVSSCVLLWSTCLDFISCCFYTGVCVSILAVVYAVAKDKNYL